jgi:HSP20 family protein
LPVRLDVKEDDKAFHVTADLPGLTEKEVNVSFDEGVLTIRGEKKLSRDEKSDTWHIVERSSGSFARQLSVSAGVDIEKIEAKFDKGVLSVTLPKVAEEQSRARKIDIKTA